VVGGAHALEEEVVAVEELAVLLQQVHGDGQHAALHVGQAVAQLVQEGFEQVAGLGDGDDAGGAGVVHAVVEVVNAAGVDNLLARDVGAGDGADACRQAGRQARWCL
jgi:hypothetical protein